MGNEKAKIRNRYGKVLCEIKCPSPLWGELLPFVRVYQAWEDVRWVERWAWAEAQVIDAKRNIVTESLTAQMLKAAEESLDEKVSLTVSSKDLYCYPCIVCGQETVVPVHTKWFGLVWGSFQGYTCVNDDCPMKKAVIPKILIERITEMPEFDIE